MFDLFLRHGAFPDGTSRPFHRKATITAFGQSHVGNKLRGPCRLMIIHKHRVMLKHAAATLIMKRGN